KADKGLVDKTVQEILVNKESEVRLVNKYDYKKLLPLVASFVFIVAIILVYSLWPKSFSNNDLPGKNLVDNSNSVINTEKPSFAEHQDPKSTEAATTENGFVIPAIELPKKESNVEFDMIGLFVYNGKIYTQTTTSIDFDSAKKLLGNKLGTTKANIDEWSTQDEYAKEFASSIGKEDVYTVIGYDKEFRLMTYIIVKDGISGPYKGAQFYECLNGITIQNGKDIFGKLNLEGNIETVYYRRYNDWYYGIENFHEIDDIELYNEFVNELNYTVPYTAESIEEFQRNQNSHKELIFKLKDGSRVSMAIYKNGYINYGYSNVYFKMEHEIFQKLWAKLD
ncbi:MAG: hypothetical protein GX783_13830, partial [Clostridiales bacterium]|nr:hypothetical protein [Clostridiales bacterium]